MDRKKLLAEMMTGIGGSEAGPVLGISPWNTPLELYQIKTGIKEPDDLSDNDAVLIGSMSEDLVAELYQIKTGQTVRKSNVLHRSKEHPFMIAHLDRTVVGQDKLLEIKTSGSAEGWGEKGSSEIPDVYLAQVTHYLHVCDKQTADVAVLIAGRDFRVFTISRANVADLEKAIVEQETEFWDRVQRRDPPPAICSRDLSSLAEKGIFVEAPDGFFSSIEKRRILVAQRDEIEKQLDEIEESIKMTIGESTGVVLDGRTLVTWKKTKDGIKIDLDRLEEENAELLKKYEIVRPGYRKLHFPKIKGE